MSISLHDIETLRQGCRVFVSRHGEQEFIVTNQSSQNYWVCESFDYTPGRVITPSKHIRVIPDLTKLTPGLHYCPSCREMVPHTHFVFGNGGRLNTEPMPMLRTTCCAWCVAMSFTEVFERFALCNELCVQWLMGDSLAGLALADHLDELGQSAKATRFKTTLRKRFGFSGKF